MEVYNYDIGIVNNELILCIEIVSDSNVTSMNLQLELYHISSNLLWVPA